MPYEIKYNKHSKRHVVFKVPKGGGFPWRVVKSFKKKKQAEDWVKKQK